MNKKSTGTLIEALNWWAIERKDVVAIATESDQITHAELASWGEALAQWLIEQGLQTGDRVAMLATNSLECCVLTQGVLRAGGIMAPINPRFTVGEVEYMLERYEPTFVFHDDERKEVAEKASYNFKKMTLKVTALINELRDKKPESIDLRADITPSLPTVIISTSGSTGRPKGVVYSHQTMLCYLMELVLSDPAAYDNSRMILFAPLCVASGYLVMTQHLAYGGTVYVYDTFDEQRALNCIVENKITELTATPIFLERIAALPEFEKADVSSVVLASVGGSRVSDSLLQVWLDKGVLIRQLYGQTEAGGQATLNSREAALTHPEKCGRGMPLTQIAIKDAKGDFCPPDTTGEIVVKGPGVMVGYWRDEETTAKTIIDGWLHTGDLGVVDENGSLTFVDRIKDIIISGGLNISAAELERVITEFDGVIEAAVIAAIDEKFGETPLAIIHSTENVNVPALIAYCNERLSDFKIPRYVVIIDEPLPRLSSGKISKVQLREIYANAHLELSKVR